MQDTRIKKGINNKYTGDGSYVCFITSKDIKGPPFFKILFIMVKNLFKLKCPSSRIEMKATIRK